MLELPVKDEWAMIYAVCEGFHSAVARMSEAKSGSNLAFTPNRQIDPPAPDVASLIRATCG
jgi:hypothetical protein